MPWLLILFVLAPALELYILIQIGQVIGAANTFLLILATGLFGSWLAKTQGVAVWRALNERFSRGEIPGRELMDGAIILVCGALLLTPGVVTDVIGLLGLIPGTRAVFRKVIRNVFTANPAVRVGVHFGGHYNTMRANASTAGSTESASTAGQPQDLDSESSQAAATISGKARSRPTYTDHDLNQ
jgi:UPF0716 protein FxsA